MKSFNKKIKVFIEIVPFKFLFLNNKVPQVLCGIYHTVTELAVCEPPTSFCGYEKKKSVLYSMSKKLHEDFCSLMKFLHENMYCTVCPKKKKAWILYCMKRASSTGAKVHTCSALCSLTLQWKAFQNNCCYLQMMTTHRKTRKQLKHK